MLQNYLKIAFRNIRKRKLFAGINILGLSIAIACSLLLFLTAVRELSYDRYHENGASIYRTFLYGQSPEGVKITATMAIPFLPALLDKIPDIKYGTRWAGDGASVGYKDKYTQTGIRFADPDFLKMFSFPLLKGDPETVLNDLGNIVLSEKRAQEIFGEEDPMGKNIRVNFSGQSKDFIVTGILKKIPPQSTLGISMVVRFEHHPAYKTDQENWGNSNHSVFIQLADQSDRSPLEEKLIPFSKEVFAEDIEQLSEAGWVADENGNHLSVRLQPLFDLHFGTAIAADSSSNTRGYIYPIALIIMGFFILAIACINFINLTIGSSVNRSLEVGVRKVLGASRQQLTFQFWGESIVIILCSIAIAMMAVQWLLPYYNDFFKTPVTINNPIILASITLILIFVAIIGGAYPAFIISRFQAASVLKKQTQLQKPGKLRNFLVVIQFAISIMLISATIVVYQQLEYLHNKPLGFNKEHVISIPVGEDISGERALSLMQQKLKNHPDIIGITGSYTNMGMGLDGSASTSITGFIQDGKQLYSHWHGAHYNYLNTLDIELLAGRTFDPLRATDSIDAIIINESLAKQLGDDMEALIGTEIKTDPNRTIIGIVKDYHFKSLDQAIEPMSLIIDPEFEVNYIFLKTKPENMPQTMGLLKKTWSEVSPKSTFEASFLDENVNRQYKSETTLSQIVFGASLLTILLSCMGLFAIALLTIIQRTKEIGIRKVLGASIGNIVSLVSKDFIQLVLIACLIAIPFAWYSVNHWLSDFHYRIDIPWWSFVLAGIAATMIAFLTVSFHSVRAAISNPIDALKDE